MKCLIVAVVCAFIQSSVAVGRFYDSSHDDSNFDESSGVWTDWMNSDQPVGTGEWEDVKEQTIRDSRLGICTMLCNHPIAMDVKPTNPDHDWDEINTCTTAQQLDAAKGYMCLNTYQKNTSMLPQICMDSYCEDNALNRRINMTCDYCPDVTVRYFCVGTREDLEAEACDHLEARSLDRQDWERNYRREMLAEIAAKAKKRHHEEESASTLAKLLREMIKDLE